MKKLPDITLNDWLEAEQSAGLAERARPKNSVTIEEFAKLTGRRYRTAQTALKALVDLGFATREHWYGHRNFYVLTKK